MHKQRGERMEAAGAGKQCISQGIISTSEKICAGSATKTSEAGGPLVYTVCDL